MADTARRYVAAMSDAELEDLLDADARRASGRCVSPPILRSAREEVARRRAASDQPEVRTTKSSGQPADLLAALQRSLDAAKASPLPLHRTEAGYPSCSTCDGGGCPDCTDPVS